MSRIDDLIAELCPDGVPHRALDQVVTFQKGEQLKAEDRIDGPYPVVTAGRTNESTHQEFNFGAGSVTVSSHGAYAGHINYWAEPIWLSNNVFLLAPSVPHLETRFLFFALKSRQQRVRDRVRGGGVPYMNARDLAPLRIPVPPLEVQREIVRVLDQFTQLEAELEAELEARRRQYEHYKSGAFEPLSETTQVPLGELVDLLQGFPFKSSMYVESGIRIVRISDVQKGAMSDKDLKYYPESAEDEIERYKLNAGDLVMSLSGSVGRVAMLAESDLPAALNQRVACIRPNTPRVITRYLYHYLNTNRFEQEAIASTSGGTVKNLSSRWLKEILIPLPTIEAQERIVSILDKFDALVNDLSSGLPAELAARRKQYEYYRDKLLTFEEAAA